MSASASLTITGYSTALFATWYFVDDLALLLDCGDGACAGLLQKSHKVRTIAISHADRDHLNGLPQFLQLNARERGLPAVLYPRDCQSFPTLRDFLHQFDRRDPEPNASNRWVPVVPGKRCKLGKAKAWVEAVENRHIETEPGQVKSVSYRVARDHHRLKGDYVGLEPGEIAELRSRLGDDAVMDRDIETLLAYSADMPIEGVEFWGNPKILIHEATFLKAEDAVTHRQELRHSALDQVIAMARNLPLEALIVGHFSTRYAEREICDAVIRECSRHRPGFPVHAVLPGRIHRDILGSRPLWAP